MHPLLALILASQPRPGAPGDRAPDRDWDLQHLHLDLRLDPDAGRIEGHATLRVAPLSPPSPTLRLDQHGLEVRGVSVDGQPVAYTLEDTAIRVTLDPSRGAQELRVDYAAAPQEGLYFRRPGPGSPDTYPELWTQGEADDNRHWIPLPDHPGDRFTSSGRFEAPEGWTVLSNGTGQQQGRVWTYRMDQELVSYLVALAAAPYAALKLPDWRGRPVAMYLPPDADRAEAQRLGDKLSGILDFLSDQTGVEYPYPTYREVYVQRYMFGAMENTTLTVSNRNLLGVPGAPPLGVHNEEVSAHEAAHHWFGDLLTCRHWTELWLNEGFANFYAWEWIRLHRSESAWARHQVDMLRWASGAGVLSGRFWSTADGSHGDSSGVYVKGASVLYMLRAMLGEQTFNQGIRRYVAQNRDRLVDTEDLRRAFEELTGDDLRWFFDQWVHWPAPPKVSAEGRHADGQYTLRLRQQLEPGQAPFTMRLEVELGGPTPTRRTLWLDAEQVAVVIPSAEAPLYVALDPEGTLPVQLELEQPASAWAAQLGASTAVARVRALRALAEKDPDPAVVEQLGALIRSADAEFQAEAAYTLSRWDTPEARALLLELLDPGRVLLTRLAAVDALARLPQPPAVVGTLRGLLQAPEARLRAQAMRSLRHLDRDRTLEAARRVLRASKGTSPVVLEAALDVLGQSGQASDLGAVLPWVGLKSPDTLIFTAMDGALRLAHRATPEGWDTARAQVARALEGLLSSADVRVRHRALGQLAEVGDEDTQRLLRAWALTRHEPTERQRALDVAAGLRAQAPARQPEAAEGAARLEALEERLEALEAELETMQQRR